LLSEAEILHYLSLQPQNKEVWKDVPDLAQFSAIKRDPESSSFGLLGKFPVELLHNIFENLDLQSLSRVLQTCLEAKGVVESLPAYRDLILYACPIFSALSQMGIINLHSAGTIYAALKSDRCARCKIFGENLFLPTCERCCQKCHGEDPAFWVIKIDADTGAAAAFNLKPEQLASVPSFYNFGDPDDGQRRSPRNNNGLMKERRKYITGKAALELGIQANGTREALDEYTNKYSTSSSIREIRYFRWYDDVDDGWVDRMLEYNQLDHYDTWIRHKNLSQFGIIPFPSFTNNELDRGRICHGCKNAPELRSWGMQSKRVFAHVTHARHRVYSRAEFLEHVQRCPNAQEDIAKIVELRDKGTGTIVVDSKWFQNTHHDSIFRGRDNSWRNRNPGCAWGYRMRRS